MLVYDPTTKEKTEMEISNYLNWLKSIGDSIQILPIRRDGYTPLIAVYKDKQKVNYHCVGITQEESNILNSHLPKMRKTTNSFNLKKVV
jgi:hypothetical protein